MIDPTLTVNDVIARHPKSVTVFNAFGIDACCGGAVPVREAALRDGTDPDALLDALAATIEWERRGDAERAEPPA